MLLGRVGLPRPYYLLMLLPRERLRKNRAIIAVARRLIGRIRASFRKQEPFKIGDEPLTQLAA